MKKLKNLLRRARKERRLSYREIARLTGIDHAQIFKIEKGQTPDPHFSLVMRLCKLLDIDPWKIKP